MIPGKSDLIADVSDEIQKYFQDPRNVIDSSRFIKGGKGELVLSVSIQRDLASKYFRQVKALPKVQLFDYCQTLLETGDRTCLLIAFDWAYRLKKQYEPQDFKILEGWVIQYVDDWAKCDDLSTHALGYFLWTYPEYLNHIYGWTNSENMWLRRAAAVSLVPPARNNELTDAVFKVADLLLTDSEDLVQKGYGWMLKVASKHQQKAVFDYVMKNKNIMSRTALRYAIEKMPGELKKRAMA